MSNTAAATKPFQVGATYYAVSACDHTCVWTFTVTARTAKFLTLTDDAGKSVRVGLRAWNGVESCSPLGTYSMAPVLTAEKVLVPA